MNLKSVIQVLVLLHMNAHSHTSVVHQEFKKNEIIQAYLHGANNNNKNQQTWYSLPSSQMPSMNRLLQTYMEYL